MGVRVQGHSMMPAKYKHPEAFCLMLYHCSKCGHSETFWNSRDGVTPFMVSCLVCAESMQHIAWHMDKCEPEHKPKKGDRVFIDLTKERYIEQMTEYVKMLFAEDVHDIRGRYASEEEAVKAFTSDFQEGSPDIIVWEEE